MEDFTNTGTFGDLVNILTNRKAEGKPVVEMTVENVLFGIEPGVDVAYATSLLSVVPTVTWDGVAYRNGESYLSRVYNETHISIYVCLRCEHILKPYEPIRRLLSPPRCAPNIQSFVHRLS